MISRTRCLIVKGIRVIPQGNQILDDKYRFYAMTIFLIGLLFKLYDTAQFTYSVRSYK
jgi:hypothetical protein